MIAQSIARLAAQCANRIIDFTAPTTVTNLCHSSVRGAAVGKPRAAARERIRSKAGRQINAGKAIMMIAAFARQIK